MLSMGVKRQVEYADLRLASLNNLSRLWDIEAAPGCLASGPEAIRANILMRWSRV